MELTIPADGFDALFPFCFVLDTAGRVQFTGHSLQRLCPELTIGRPLSEYFSLVSPEGPLDFPAMSRRSNDLFRFKALQGGLLLRGQLLLSTDKRWLIACCCPAMDDIQAFTALGLTREDFALHDRVFDLLPQLTTVSGAPATSPYPDNPKLAELHALGGEELVAELLAEFQVQVESDVEEIADAAKAGKFTEVARLAHRLKGGSTTVGVTPIADLCTELEGAAAARSRRELAALLERMMQEVTALRPKAGPGAERSKPIRILIADDHPVVRFGVRRMLQGSPQYVVVGEASDGKDALRQMKESMPDILLLDLNMPSLPGLETLRELTTIQIPTKTILLTSAISQREVLEALQLGARGVLLKDALATDLSACIATVMQGHYWLGSKPVQNLVQVLHDLMEEINQPPQNTFGLTARELQVVRLIAQGLTNKDIARECNIAEETVKRHLKNIFDKVGVWNRLELALFAINNHLVAENAAAA